MVRFWIAGAVCRDLRGLVRSVDEVGDEAERRFGGLGPFAAAEVACLVGHAFIGSEALLLVGWENRSIPARKALRKFALLIRQMEDCSST